MREGTWRKVVRSEFGGGSQVEWVRHQNDISSYSIRGRERQVGGERVCVCEKTHDWHLDIYIMTSYIFSIFELNHIECILHTTALLNNLPGDLMDCGKLKPKHWLAHEHCQSLRLWRLGLSIICSDGLSWLYSALHIPTLQSNVLKSYKELHYQTCSKHNLPKTPKEPMDMSKTCVFGHREICLWKSMAYSFFCVPSLAVNCHQDLALWSRWLQVWVAASEPKS